MSNRKYRSVGVALAVTAAAAGAATAGWQFFPPNALADPEAPTTTTASTTASTSDSATASTTTSATTSTTPTTTSATEAGYPSDSLGYLDTGARCDEGQTVMAFGRTSRALVAICVGPDGQLEYRGVRLDDEATLTMPADRGSGGAIVASNNGVTYSVSPEIFLVSEGDTVLYRDAWVEFREPRFSDTPSSTDATSSATSTSSTTPPPSETTTTVSTTTVTLTPDPEPSATGG